MKTNRIANWLMAGSLVVAALSITSCEDQPDKYEVASGQPTVYYVRSPYAADKDSLMAGAYMGNTICIVGDNLRSIVELYFNDQKATLNMSYITDHTMLVDVPNELPNNPTDKMYMVTKASDTISYDFSVLIPAPVVNSMSNEYAPEGTLATIYGDYFLDYADNHLEVTMPGGVKVTDFKEISKTSITFTVPSGAEPGYITVSSKYGKSRSRFNYLDDRNVLFDFDDDGDNALAAGLGWRSGNIRNDEHSLDGGYLYFGGAQLAADGYAWPEDQFCLNYWPTETSNLGTIPTMATLLNTKSLTDLQMKFEVQVPSANPWTSTAMQIMLTPIDMVSQSNMTNAYYGENSLPRALWMPWTQSGSYDTANEWTTITIPLSNFNKTATGGACDTSLTPDYICGLTIFVWSGGQEGVECSPEFFIDNIRIVPIE